MEVKVESLVLMGVAVAVGMLASLYIAPYWQGWLSATTTPAPSA
jgi:hypothetical protein